MAARLTVDDVLLRLDDDDDVFSDEDDDYGGDEVAGYLPEVSGEFLEESRDATQEPAQENFEDDLLVQGAGLQLESEFL